MLEIRDYRKISKVGEEEINKFKIETTEKEHQEHGEYLLDLMPRNRPK